MKAAILILSLLFGGCVLTSIEEARPVTLVDAQPQGGRVFEVTLRAPFASDLYLENCNGAINWGLADAADPVLKLRWSVLRNQCLSPPVKLAAGTSKTFRMQVPRVREDGPKPGLYRIVMLGVYTAWEGSRPLQGPQLALEDRVSGTVVIGDDAAPGEVDH